MLSPIRDLSSLEWEGKPVPSGARGGRSAIDTPFSLRPEYLWVVSCFAEPCQVHDARGAGRHSGPEGCVFFP